MTNWLCSYENKDHCSFVLRPCLSVLFSLYLMWVWTCFKYEYLNFMHDFIHLFQVLFFGTRNDNKYVSGKYHMGRFLFNSYFFIFSYGGILDKERKCSGFFLHMRWHAADKCLCYCYIVQSLYYLNSKIQGSNHLLWLYSIVCVGSGQKPGFLAQPKWAASWENQQSAYAKTKTQISFAVTAKLISAFVFATWIVQYLFFLNTKFQASSHLQ